MAKNEQTTQKAAATDALDANSQALIAALTAAIVSSRQNAAPLDQDATDAAAEYAEIKAALRTFGEPFNSVGSGFPRRNARAQEN
jgi:hypothetical protein